MSPLPFLEGERRGSFAWTRENILQHGNILVTTFCLSFYNLFILFGLKDDFTKEEATATDF
jgi:hypothetical protein